MLTVFSKVNPDTIARFSPDGHSMLMDILKSDHPEMHHLLNEDPNVREMKRLMGARCLIRFGDLPMRAQKLVIDLFDKFKKAKQ
jgi:hypothetical protein